MVSMKPSYLPYIIRSFEVKSSSLKDGKPKEINDFLVLLRDLICVWLVFFDQFIKKTLVKSHLYLNLTTLVVLKKKKKIC